MNCVTWKFSTGWLTQETFHASLMEKIHNIHCTFKITVSWYNLSQSSEYYKLYCSWKGLSTDSYFKGAMNVAYFLHEWSLYVWAAPVGVKIKSNNLF